MKIAVNLKDGTELIIRPLNKDDLDRSYNFFQALPEEDRTYLRRDVTKLSVVKQRIRSMRTDRVKRLVAIYEDEIVADGSLEMGGTGWEEHIGELRLIVLPHFQRKGLGRRMAKELYLLAAKERVEEIVVKMMRPQVDAQKIFKRLGFTEDATLRGYAKDLSGVKQDLIVMRCSLKSLWKDLEDYYVDSDWQRTR
jgi:ribosomal protein S18 acetylase RimI-like enzyme